MQLVATGLYTPQQALAHQARLIVAMAALELAQVIRAAMVAVAWPFSKSQLRVIQALTQAHLL
jgi:hypothetical protein